jgi:cell division protein FtsW (lipid II flippase)
MTLKIKTFVSALYLSPFMLLIAKIMTTRYLAVRFYNAFHYKLDPVDSGYSMVKAQEFISSGGLFGIGFKNTVTSEVDPLTSISQCFILQYTGKEAGMAGLIMVAGICAVFLFSGFRLIQKIDTREQYIAAKCMFLWLFIPMFFGLIKILNISSGFPPYSIPFMSFSNGYNVSCYLALGGLLHYVIANSRNVSDSFKTLSEESESSQPLPK